MSVQDAAPGDPTGPGGDGVGPGGHGVDTGGHGVDTGGDAAVPLVASAGGLDPVVALLRALLHAAAAVRATAVVPDGAGPPAVVDAARLLPVEVARGADVVHLAHAAPQDAPVPAVPEFRTLPAFDADPLTGEIAAPLGGVEHRARATAQAADALPPGSVLQLSWETTREGVPFSITARTGGDEPFVLGVGDEAFPMPAGWP